MAVAERLSTYAAKRDFAVTSEPAGGAPPAEDGHRFVVQRHRASRLHYDFRLEVDGVLASWAVPKGPTLDPGVRRMAVHVEDHPIEYFDFEGVIPRGEYGGGDVIVWDWGTWRVVDGQEPAAAVAKGDLHFELVGEKLSGRFALVRRGRKGDKEQWLLVHKRDEAAVDGWDAEDHPRSVKSGRTNDEVLADADATWTRATPTIAPWARGFDFPAATEEELRALGRLGREGEWSVGGVGVRLTNLDKPLFPARRGGKPLVKRDLVRHYATVAPFVLPHLAGRPVNPHRYPDGIDRPGFWHRALPDHAPDWITRFQYDDAEDGEVRCLAVVDSLPTLVWMANHGAVELNAWTSRVEDVHQPTWALIDIDPGERTSWTETRDLACLYRTALDHLGVRGGPVVTGQRGIQIRVPVAAGCSFDETRSWVERLSRAVGASLPDVVSWEWRTKDRRGRARLDYTQNAINKTLVAPFSTRPRPGATVAVPITWDELDDPALRPDRWTVRSIGRRLSATGDPLRPLVGLQQHLPEL